MYVCICIYIYIIKYNIIIFIEYEESLTNNQTINKDVQARAGVGHLRPAHLKHACRDYITERFDNISIKNIIR